MNESGFSYLYHYMKGVLVEEGKRKSSVSFSLTYMRWKDEMGNFMVSGRRVNLFHYFSRKIYLLANTIYFYRLTQFCLSKIFKIYVKPKDRKRILL